jgi:hypothetical protein
MLRLHRGEVLHLVAGATTQVLPEPVHQLRKMQRIQHRPPVAITVRLHRGTVCLDLAVGRQRQRQDHRRPILPPIRRSEHPPYRAILHHHPRKIGRVVSRARRPHLPPDQPAMLLIGPVLVILRRRIRMWRGEVVSILSFVSAVPTRAHCCIRSQRALSTHAAHTASRVEPHGIATLDSPPVAWSITRRTNGRPHTRCSTASCCAIPAVTTGTDPTAVCSAAAAAIVSQA